jgi:hypothetical protein
MFKFQVNNLIKLLSRVLVSSLLLMFLGYYSKVCAFYEVISPDNGVESTLNGYLQIAFPGWHNNEEIPTTWDNGANGLIRLVKLNGEFLLATIVEDFPVDSPQIFGHGTSQATIIPTNNFENNTCYYVYVSGCAVLQDNSISPGSTCTGQKNFLEIGLDNNNFNTPSWSFKTGNVNCPWDPPLSIINENASVLHVSPPTLSTQIQKSQSINITFSKNVTYKEGNFVLKKYNDNSVLETIPVNSSQVTGWGTSRVIINPSVNFTDNTQYYVNMDFNNFRNITDKDSWTFTIQKYPSVLSGSGL